MSLAYMEITCPSCGNKTKENCNTWGYGSPIKICGNCHSEFLDRRFTEPAVEGFDKKSTNSDFYLKGMIFLLILSAVSVAVLFVMSKMNGYYSLKMILCAAFSAIGAILCAVMFLRIKLGFADKENRIFLEESEKRLQNRDYAEKLRGYGYNVPEKYL